MADYSGTKSAADLEREIESQRTRVEDTIDQIQARLSPGQLVDELLSYTKAGGGQFAANLGRTISDNPLPVALLGVSLAWLMARPGQEKSPVTYSSSDWDRRDGRDYREHYGAFEGQGYEDEDETYPYASIRGSSLQRVGQVSDEAGLRYSEFTDDSGRKFRALTDEAGNRIGHFADEAGNMFRGFTDAAGNRIGEFRDEAGNLLSDASGWASDTWRQTRARLQDAQHTLGQGANVMARGAGWAGHQMQRRAGRASRSMMHLYEDQPLVGGALAFAVGAAIAAGLPHTEQEDRLLGDAAEKVKREAGNVASQLYEKGKEKVGALHEDVASKAGELYEEGKARLAGQSESGYGAQTDTVYREH